MERVLPWAPVVVLLVLLGLLGSPASERAGPAASDDRGEVPGASRIWRPAHA